jgi:hypothetical protein
MLVSGELEDKSELLRLCICIFVQNAVGVGSISKNVRLEGIGNQCKLEVALISAVSGRCVINDVIRIERRILALRLKGKAYSAFERYGIGICSTAVICDGGHRIETVLNAKFNFVISCRH